MSSFQLQSFDTILAGLEETCRWLNSINIDTQGTRLETISSHVREIIDGISREDREEHFRERPPRLDYWAIVDGASFKLIWEQLRDLPSNRLPRRALKEAIRGHALDPMDEVPGSGSENARNFQAELETAAQISASGIPILGFDDVELDFHNTRFIVECKRISRAGQVESNILKANSQIQRRLAEHDRGLIAIAAEKLLGLDELPPQSVMGSNQQLAEIARNLSQPFYREHGAAFAELEDRVIGIMLLLRFIFHDLSHGGYSVARYITITPLHGSSHPNHALIRSLAEALAPRNPG